MSATRVWTFILLFTYALTTLIQAQNISITVIGSGNEGDAVLSTPPESVMMRNPSFVEVIESGPDPEIAFSDTGNHVIRLLSNGVVTVVVGTPGQSGMSPDNTTVVGALIDSPTGILQSELFGFIFCDSGNDRVMRVDPMTQTIHTLAETDTVANFSCSGLAQNPNGNLVYIADHVNTAIWTIDSQEMLTRLAVDLAGPPVDITIVPQLAVFPDAICVPVPSRHIIQIFLDREPFTLTLGTIDSPGFTAAGASILSTGNLNTPMAVTSSANRLYISETGSEVIRVAFLATDTLLLGNLLGNRIRGFAGDATSLVEESQVNTPLGLALDNITVYAVDSRNYRIREFSGQEQAGTLPPIDPPTVAMPTFAPSTEPPTTTAPVSPTQPATTESPTEAPTASPIAPTVPTVPVAPSEAPSNPVAPTTIAPTRAPPSSAFMASWSMFLLGVTLLSLL